MLPSLAVSQLIVLCVLLLDTLTLDGQFTSFDHPFSLVAQELLTSVCNLFFLNHFRCHQFIIMETIYMIQFRMPVG